ncbi:hypothetical protein [Enterobacter cloacae]|uniref:Uncharacterized protein n=1 Tax=Enterobacter cloacae TaxID=550 RepID=A0A6S5JZI8_ENTCL|nr:hypothetical protein [Enterobacter cloacae]BBS32870.1 hypothetical protein WP5S18C02_30760 [Enterobacter cloacae]
MSTIAREFTKEQLQQIIETDHVQCGEASALARIALASLEAEPVCFIDQSNLDYLKSGSDADVWPASRTEMGDVLLYRAAPPAPVALPSGYSDFEEIWSSSTHPLTQDDEMKDFAWDIWNACRAAMLQGAEQQNRQQNIPENIPATQFKPVADLYGLTSPTGGETSFTFDAVEARDFIDGGWSCQEYVELGRFQEAVSGNSPVIPGCSCLTCRPLTFSDSRFVVCPECGNKRCPHANDHRNACTGSNEPGQEGSAYPAAPQQEVESQIRKGKTVAMEEWELGARLTKHRFKP